MTETTLLPGQSGSDAPVDESTESSIHEGNRRKVLLAGGGAGVVVLAAAAFFLLHGGSSQPSTAPVPHGTPVSAATRSSTGTATSGSTTTTKKKHVTATHVHRVKAVTARDPFAPLVTPPVTTSGSTSKAKVTNVPAATPSTGSNPTSQPTTPPTTSKHAVSPTAIELESTSGSEATFLVSYPHNRFHVFKVDAPEPGASNGTVFGRVFSLLGIQGSSVTIQVGDATPFDLEKGFQHKV